MVKCRGNFLQLVAREPQQRAAAVRCGHPGSPWIFNDFHGFIDVKNCEHLASFICVYIHIIHIQFFFPHLCFTLLIHSDIVIVCSNIWGPPTSSNIQVPSLLFQLRVTALCDLCRWEEVPYFRQGLGARAAGHFQWVDKKGTILTGKHRFSHELWDFPVFFPNKTNQLTFGSKLSL